MSLSEQAAKAANEEALKRRQANHAAYQQEVEVATAHLAKYSGFPVRYLEARELAYKERVYRGGYHEGDTVKRTRFAVYAIDDIEVIYTYPGAVGYNGTGKEIFLVRTDPELGPWVLADAVWTIKPRDDDDTEETRRDRFARAVGERLNRGHKHPIIEVGTHTCPTCGKEL